jgi:hypothetical protein
MVTANSDAPQGDNTMNTTWLKDELRRIAEADDLHISLFHEDGKTYGAPHGSGPSWWMTAFIWPPHLSANFGGEN